MNPDERRDQGVRCTTASWCPRGGSVVAAPAPDAASRWRDPLADVDAIVEPAPRRGRRVLRRDPARRAPATTRSSSSARPSPGMLWSKQIYLFDVNQWLEGDNPALAAARSRARGIRNTHWRHLNSMRVLSMPDKWEYPWFAAWDLAFHCVAAGAGRPGVRQGAALAAALRAVPASLRPDPRLRVGVLRPEPARARLGGLARLQHGPHPHAARPTASSWRSASTSC